MCIYGHFPFMCFRIFLSVNNIANTCMTKMHTMTRVCISDCFQILSIIFCKILSVNSAIFTLDRVRDYLREMKENFSHVFASWINCLHLEVHSNLPDSIQKELIRNSFALRNTIRLRKHINLQSFLSSYPIGQHNIVLMMIRQKEIEFNFHESAALINFSKLLD